MTDSIMTATAVSGGYDRADVIHGISITVRPGETVCLLGPNGAGKTTFLRALSGTLRRRRGTIELMGDDVSRLPTHARVRRGLVHVTQERRTVLPHLTVGESLQLAGHRGGGTAGGFGLNDAQAVFPILRDRWNQRATTLSGGEQQMLALAQGFLLNPVCLLLDEPSTGLAPIVVEELFERIAEVASRGQAMVLAEQRVDLALAIASRGYVFEAGQCVADGSAGELRDDASLTRAYLGTSAE